MDAEGMMEPYLKGFNSKELTIKGETYFLSGGDLMVCTVEDGEDSADYLSCNGEWNDSIYEDADVARDMEEIVVKLKDLPL